MPNEQLEPTAASLYLVTEANKKFLAGIADALHKKDAAWLDVADLGRSAKHDATQQTNL